MTPFERNIVQKRAAIIKRSKPIFAIAIKKQYQQAIKCIRSHSPETIHEHLRESIKKDPVQLAFKMTYPLAADVAMMWRRRLLNQKDGVEDLHKRVIQTNLSHFAQIKGKERISSITHTTFEQIKGVVNYVIDKAREEGLGITSTREMIIEYVGQNYDDISDQRAQLISQTEMITASNQATMEGARSTGYGFKKYWSTSGLDNVRDSHLECEQFSIDNGGLAEDEIFPNGLLYPGDPAGEADEVCNCHCTLLTEIDKD